MSNIRILVVEDEENIRLFLTHLLQRDGYEAVAVSNGKEALALINSETFDLAILDLNLGQGLNGIQILSYLRETSQEMSVIVLTGHATLDTAVDALRLGAHDYLFKPCEANMLRASIKSGLQKRLQAQNQQTLLSRLEQDLSNSLQTIRHALIDVSADESVDKTEEPSERFLRHDGLIVDAIRHVVTFDGLLLSLSPMEFDTLFYLLRTRPRVVSAEEVMQHAYGYDSELTNTNDIVRTHVYRIRQKMKQASGRHIIRTVRGVGYSIAS